MKKSGAAALRTDLPLITEATRRVASKATNQEFRSVFKLDQDEEPGSAGRPPLSARGLRLSLL